MMFNDTDLSEIKKYTFLVQQITIYGGISLFVLCFIGTLMNIFTFTQCIYHRRASSLYLLCASIFDLAHLLFGFLSNILQDGFHYGWTLNSIYFCRIKSYFVYVFMINSGTLAILATIDRFLLSSNNSHLWKYSCQLFAKRCILTTSLFWLVCSIPLGFCTQRLHHPFHNEQVICRYSSNTLICLFVQIIYICLFDGFLPPLIMMIFGLITYNNIRHLCRRRGPSQSRLLPSRIINQQIVSMLVLQSIKATFASIPYSCFQIYLLITNHKRKSRLNQTKETFIMQIVYLLFCSNYTSFYVYFYSSDIFRHQCLNVLKRFVCCLFGNQRRRQRHFYRQN